MAKKDNVSAARKAFVQARATASGKTTAEDKAKFRQRFETLAATKQGRAKIQEVTGLSGIRKELASAYGKKPTGGTTTTSTTSTSKITGVGVAGPRRETEGQMESRLKASAKSTASTKTATATTATSSGARTSPYAADKGLSGIQKLLLGGGAAAVAGASLRRLNLSRIASANAANTPKPSQGITSPSPQKKAPTSGPKNRKTTGPRPSSTSAKRSSGGRGGARGGGVGGTLRGGGLDLIQ